MTKDILLKVYSILFWHITTEIITSEFVMMLFSIYSSPHLSTSTLVSIFQHFPKGHFNNAQEQTTNYFVHFCQKCIKWVIRKQRSLPMCWKKSNQLQGCNAFWSVEAYLDGVTDITWHRIWKGVTTKPEYFDFWQFAFLPRVWRYRSCLCGKSKSDQLSLAQRLKSGGNSLTSSVWR